MEVDVLPKIDLSNSTTGCCPRFDPRGWDGLHVRFDEKLFVRATTRSLLHVPINMGSVFTRVQTHIEDAGAQDPNGYLVLSRDLSGTEAEHFFAVTRRVPGEVMTTLSGTFLTRVFEGPYRDAKAWFHQMETAAELEGNWAKRIFMFYTTCPKCAKAYGKNYVVGFAET